MSVNVTMEPHAVNTADKATEPRYLAIEVIRMSRSFNLMPNSIYQARCPDNIPARLITLCG